MVRFTSNKKFGCNYPSQSEDVKSKIKDKLTDFDKSRYLKVLLYLSEVYGVNLRDMLTNQKEEPKEILWQSGKSINYTIKVAEQNDISFAQPTIDPWGSPQTGGTIIIQ